MHCICSSESGKGHCCWDEGSGSGGAGEEGGRDCFWGRLEGQGGETWEGIILGYSLEEGGGKDWSGLCGSSLTSLAGESREGGREGELSRRRSKGGEDRGAEHLTRPAGPECPLIGCLHFLQALPAAAAGSGSTTSSLGAGGEVALSTRGAVREDGGERAGGRADSPSTSASCSSILASLLLSSRKRAAGPC